MPGKTASCPQAWRPREAREPLSLEPLCRWGAGAGRRVMAASAVQRGPGRQRGGRRAVAEVKATKGAPACVLGSRGRHRGTRSPAPPVGRRKRLLLFGEETESLFLVFLAEAGVRAGDGGQGQALGLDADALGLADGRAHALQPGQHLLLQGGRVRASHLPRGPTQRVGGALGLPCTYLILAVEEPLAAIAQPRRTKGSCPVATSGALCRADGRLSSHGPLSGTWRLLREVRIWPLRLKKSLGGNPGMEPVPRRGPLSSHECEIRPPGTGREQEGPHLSLKTCFFFL